MLQSRLCRIRHKIVVMSGNAPPRGLIFPRAGPYDPISC